MADLFAKYNCTYCQDDIAGLRIKCAECTDFDLCLQCFSAGAEIGIHKNDHSYQFMDSGSIGVCLGRGGWSAREELHLLDAIEQYGFGNWEDISRHIETRTPEEAKEEYVARFLEGSIGQLTWPVAGASRTVPKLTDHTSADSGPLSPEVTSRLPPPDASREEATLLGYMAQRDDFEREFDNTAESLVSPLYVNNIEDDELDINLKLAQVDMFTRRLRARTSRKRVVRDYQLISQFFAATRKEKTSAAKKKPTKEQKDLSDRLRVFTRFHTAQEHDQFVQGLVQKQDLKFRLSELVRYRRNGLTSKEECVHFEQERVLHDHWKEKKSGSSESRLISSPMEQRRGIERNEASCSPVSPYQSQSGCSNNPDSPDNHGEGMECEEEGDTLTSLSSCPAHQLLSPNEIKLCESLKLEPIQYVSWKSVLLKEHLPNGMKKETFISSEDSDSGREKEILDYLVSNGWVAVS